MTVNPGDLPDSEPVERRWNHPVEPQSLSFQFASPERIQLADDRDQMGRNCRHCSRRGGVALVIESYNTKSNFAITKEYIKAGTSI